MIHRIVFDSQEVIVHRGGGLPPSSGPRLKHPNIPLPWREAAHPNFLEVERAEGALELATRETVQNLGFPYQ